MKVRPSGGELGIPLPREDLEPIRGPVCPCGLLGLPIRTWIDATHQQLTGCISPISGLLQAHIWIDTKRKALLFAVKPVSVNGMGATPKRNCLIAPKIMPPVAPGFQ